MSFLFISESCFVIGCSREYNKISRKSFFFCFYCDSSGSDQSSPITSSNSTKTGIKKDGYIIYW